MILSTNCLKPSAVSYPDFDGQRRLSTFQSFGSRLTLLLLGVMSLSGCALCANPFDHDYVTYGSRTPRTDMKCGRVGSVFSDPAINATHVIENIDAIDSGYAEVLESDEVGPAFQDEPMEIPSIIEIPDAIAPDQPIQLGPAR
jgi:hypothetical protein